MSRTKGAAAPEELSDRAHEAVENLREVAGQVREAASEQYSHARQTAREWEQSLEHYVQEKPLRAVLMAAGVGFVLGWVWKRL